MYFSLVGWYIFPNFPNHYNSPLAIYPLLFRVYLSSFAICHLSCTISHLPFTAYNSPFTICHFTTYHLPLTNCILPFTIPLFVLLMFANNLCKYLKLCWCVFDGLPLLFRCHRNKRLAPYMYIYIYMCDLFYVIPRYQKSLPYIRIIRSRGHPRQAKST